MGESFAVFAVSNTTAKVSPLNKDIWLLGYYKCISSFLLEREGFTANILGKPLPRKFRPAKLTPYTVLNLKYSKLTQNFYGNKTGFVRPGHIHMYQDS